MLYIATTTFYPTANDLRCQLAGQFMNQVREAGHKVIVVDDSPDPAIPEMFSELGAIVHRQTAKGMGPGRRQAIQAIFDLAVKENNSTPIFVWIEPEKHPLIPLLEPAIRTVRAGANLVVPRRRSLASYPSYQQICEARGNWEAGSLTGAPELDLYFGPRLMDMGTCAYFLDYEGDHGDKWDSIFIPVVRVVAAGRRVTSVTVDYVHPPEQTQAEEGNVEMDKKRDVQLDTLLACIKVECEKLSLPR